MKKEWTEQDLRKFVESSQPVFQDVSLTQVDEDAARCWQDDGLMVDYELRGGQVDCVLRRCVVADGKVWQLQMTAPLAGSDLPEDRMTPRERELCRDDMNHDFLSGVFNRRYYETEFCTKLDEWTDRHRCAALALVSIDDAAALSARENDAVMGHRRRRPHPPRAGRGAESHLRRDAQGVCGLGGTDAPGALHPVHWRGRYPRGALQELGRPL